MLVETPVSPAMRDGLSPTLAIGPLGPVDDGLSQPFL